MHVIFYLFETGTDFYYLLTSGLLMGATLAAFLDLMENGGHGKEWHFLMPVACMNMFAVMPGFVKDSHNNNAVSISRFPLFQMIDSHHISTILDAVMRGEEVIAMRAIAQNPEALLETWEVKNSVDRTHVVKPLHAAIMANDIQLAEKMKAHFERLPDGLVEMHRQIKEIYTLSLERYCKIQNEKIAQFEALQDNGKSIDSEALETAQARLKSYSDALQSDDINTIVNTHHQAQEHNAFDFKPYVDAICAVDLNNP